MGEIKFTTGLILSALFIFAIVTFSIGFAGDNESRININSDPDYNNFTSGYSSDLQNFNGAVGEAGNSFNEDNVKEGTDTATSGGQFKVTAGSVLSTSTRSLDMAFKKIFGNDPAFSILFTTLVSVLALIMIRYLYKTWFGKDPD